MSFSENNDLNDYELNLNELLNEFRRHIISSLSNKTQINIFVNKYLSMVDPEKPGLFFPELHPLHDSSIFLWAIKLYNMLI